MGDILREVQRWRAKADELHATADRLSNAVAGDVLLEMADGYDRLADNMEDLEASKRARAGIFRDLR
jgi:hypothetical protein